MSFRYSGRLALQQRVLPAYRVPFFDELAQACEGGLSLFAGLPRASESIVVANEFQFAKYRSADNLHFLGGPFYLCYQKGLISWLSGCEPDALILEANPRYLSTPSGLRWMHRRGRKVLGWGLGAPSPSGVFAGLRRAGWIKFLRQFDALIAYSQRGAEEYAALGFPRDKIFVATNAVSPRPVTQPPSRPLSFNVQPVILFVGRLQARKRVDFLLRACADLTNGERAGLNPRLVIVGDGPERSNLLSLAKQIYPSAEFVGEWHGTELKPYFEAADLFVLPGTGGLAVQEAMSNSLPVLVAKGDGTQDDLVREANGWQVPPDDYGAMLGTLRLALLDVGRLRKMGKESYRIVSEEINLEKMVEAFVKALNSL
jgi:glycosyltransferase involved in cell wall biosynthesis